jgi:hypothetical protein
LKSDLIFADEEGVPRGHPQALTLVLLGYFLGDMGIPKLELLSILHLILSHHSPFPTLENFLHTKLHTILVATLV